MIYIKVVLVWFSMLGGFLFQQAYSKVWNYKLKQLMEHDVEVKVCGEYSVLIGGIRVWTANKYYSFAHAYGENLPSRRPSIKTMILFNEYVEKKLFENKA